MKVLITGGNGFIGSHLAEKLIDKNVEVSLLDLQFTSNTEKISCEKIRANILDYETVKKTVKGKDVVFHFAAVSRVIWGQQNPLDCWKVNVGGTVNLLEACRKNANSPIFFYASSREVYGDPLQLPVKESHPKRPKSVYGASKLSAEQACLAFQRAYGLRTVIMRFSNVYGSERDQMDRVIPKFMLRALRDEEIPLYGGDQVLDFNFIEDTVSGIMKAYEKALEGKIIGEDFHFVSGEGISIKELAELIVEISGSSSKIVKMPPKEFDVNKFVGDPQKAMKFLGYEPKTPLRKGLDILKERLLSTLMS